MDTENKENSQNSSDLSEPLFKYLRLACDLREIVKSSSISAIKATTKLVFVGTSWGDLYILDVSFNQDFHIDLKLKV